MKRLKKMLCVLLALLMLVAMCACSESGSDEVEAPSGFLTAENDKTDYYFFYPAEWILDRNDAGMTSVYVSDKDFTNVSITTFTASAEYPSLVDYVEKYYFKQFEGNFNNLEIEKNQDGSLKRSVLKIDSFDAIAVNYTATFSGEDYSFRAWFVSKGGYIYSILYTAKADLFEAHFDEATAIAENIKFR